MVKYIRLALPFAALLNSVVVSAFLVPIPPPINGVGSPTTSSTPSSQPDMSTAVEMTYTPTISSTMATETTSGDVMTSPMDTDSSEQTASPSDTMQVARYLKSRQVHNADYAANKNNVADSAAATTAPPAPTSASAEEQASSDGEDSTAPPPPASAAYDERK